MTMTWLQALKAHNRGKGAFCIPRRGSVEHAHVLAMMRGGVSTGPGPRARKLTRGEETFHKAIVHIEHSDALARLARKARPLSRRGI